MPTIENARAKPICTKSETIPCINNELRLSVDRSGWVKEMQNKIYDEQIFTHFFMSSVIICDTNDISKLQKWNAKKTKFFAEFDQYRWTFISIYMNMNNWLKFHLLFRFVSFVQKFVQVSRIGVVVSVEKKRKLQHSFLKLQQQQQQQ